MMQATKEVLHKDKILVLASREKGFCVDYFRKDLEILRSRMRIFELKGLVTGRRENNIIRFKITKETHLL